MNDTLNVSWTMFSPPVKARKIVAWKDFHPTPHKLDETFHWPRGTTSILEEAFRRNLDRFGSWEAPRSQDWEAYVTAAKVFKRGVEVEGQPKTHDSGSYKIQFLDNSTHNLKGPKIVDQRVADLWKIESQEDTLVVEIDERSKSLESAGTIFKFVEQQSNSQAIQIIGGGILADCAAFACHLAKKDFVLVPTTLLAMVDACVGGKTGVNFLPYGKNQIGGFAFPEKVYIWTGWLETLDERNIKCGLAECIKHCFLKGNSKALEQLQKSDWRHFVREHIQELVEVKSQVVAEDPTELSVRATLNLGHTLAHGLEAISQERTENFIFHGEAVAIGLLFSLELSYSLRVLNSNDYKLMKDSILASTIIPSKNDLRDMLCQEKLDDSIFVDLLYSKILKDKKNHSSQSHWVLLSGFGQAHETHGSFTHPVDKKMFTDIFLRFIRSLS